jgi:hypothetical protein
VFAGGRPDILATLAFLESDVCIAVEETEYTPYYDMLKILRRKVQLIPSNEKNQFRPELADYCEQLICTGHTTSRMKNRTDHSRTCRCGQISEDGSSPTDE